MTRFSTRKVVAFAVAGLVALGVVSLEAPAGTAATSPNCGARVLKANGTPWQCTFVDYFDGTRLSSTRWRVMTSNDANYGDRPDCFVNSSKNIAVSDGILRLTTRRTSAFTCASGKNAYQATGTSAMISTIGRFSQTYGRFELKAKWPYTRTGPGLHGAFWLWPNSGGMLWPVTGELDVAEWYSKYPDRAIPYLHTATSWLNPSTATNNYCVLTNPAGWHIYTLEWTSARIKIMYDGKTCLNARGGFPYNQAFSVALTQAMGIGQNKRTSATPFPSTTQISYLRVWK